MRMSDIRRSVGLSRDRFDFRDLVIFGIPFWRYSTREDQNIHTSFSDLNMCTFCRSHILKQWAPSGNYKCIWNNGFYSSIRELQMQMSDRCGSQKSDGQLVCPGIDLIFVIWWFLGYPFTREDQNIHTFIFRFKYVYFLQVLYLFYSSIREIRMQMSDRWMVSRSVGLSRDKFGFRAFRCI